MKKYLLLSCVLSLISFVCLGQQNYNARSIFFAGTDGSLSKDTSTYCMTSPCPVGTVIFGSGNAVYVRQAFGWKPIGGSSLPSVNNGLQVVSSNIGLGGTIIRNTNIDDPGSTHYFALGNLTHLSSIALDATTFTVGGASFTNTLNLNANTTFRINNPSFSYDGTNFKTGNGGSEYVQINGGNNQIFGNTITSANLNISSNFGIQLAPPLGGFTNFSNGVKFLDVPTTDNTQTNVIVRDGTTGLLKLRTVASINIPAGSNTQIQYNNSGAFGASANFTFVSGSNTMTIGGTDFTSNSGTAGIGNLAATNSLAINTVNGTGINTLKATTNAVTSPFTITTQSSGTAANNIGTGLIFSSQIPNNTVLPIGGITNFIFENQNTAPNSTISFNILDDALVPVNKVQISTINDGAINSQPIISGVTNGIRISELPNGAGNDIQMISGGAFNINGNSININNLTNGNVTIGTGTSGFVALTSPSNLSLQGKTTGWAVSWDDGAVGSGSYQLGNAFGNDFQLISYTASGGSGTNSSMTAATGAITFVTPTSDMVYTVGSNTGTIPMMLTNQVTLDFPNTTAGVSDLTATLTGAVLGDNVVLGVPNGSVTATAVFTAWVSAANTVTVRFAPKASTGENPASGIFRVSTFK